MCIAIYQPPRKRVSEEELKNSFDSNRDGAGFAYINEDYYGVKRIKIRKALTFEEFFTKFEKAVANNPASPFLIHFRIKTHGTVDKSNCHPFMIDKDHVFIHNGIITGVGYEKDKSDTRLFNDTILRGLPRGWFYNDVISRLVADFIGSSKLIIMNRDGKVRICNEKLGHWKNEIWYSNKSYEKRPPIVASQGGTWQRDSWENRWGYTPAKNPLTTQRARLTAKIKTFEPLPEQPTQEVLDMVEVESESTEYDELTEIRCENCHELAAIKECIHYYNKNGCASYCRKNCLSDGLYNYSRHEMISVDCILDWLNSDPEDEFETAYYGFPRWSNPWNQTAIEEEINLTEEAMASHYEAMRVM